MLKPFCYIGYQKICSQKKITSFTEKNQEYNKEKIEKTEKNKSLVIIIITE